jgi:outer membrane murein-binding lipoprotein Lpp
MKYLGTIALVCVLMGGCGDNSALETRVAVLESQSETMKIQIARLQKDRDTLAEASISNSESIKRNSESIIRMAGR